MTPQENMLTNTQRDVDIIMLKTLLALLFDPEQNYTPMLHSVLGETFELSHPIKITKAGDCWDIEGYNDPSYKIKFFVTDSAIEHLNFDIVFCKRKAIIHSIEELVVHIMGTYDPNGGKLLTEVKA